MKINPLPHKTILFIVLTFISLNTFSQTPIEGYIFDKQSKQSLPYPTLKIISKNNYYTITNEDGKFEVLDRFKNDSIEVRFLGFKTKTVSLSYFNQNKTLSNQLFKEATAAVNKMKLETEEGTRFQNLIKWNESINEKLDSKP